MDSFNPHRKICTFIAFDISMQKKRCMCSIPIQFERNFDFMSLKLFFFIDIGSTNAMFFIAGKNATWNQSSENFPICQYWVKYLAILPGLEGFFFFYCFPALISRAIAMHHNLNIHEYIIGPSPPLVLNYSCRHPLHSVKFSLIFIFAIDHRICSECVDTKLIN